MKEDIKNILDNTKDFQTMSYSQLVFAMDITRRILTNLLKEEEERREANEVLKPKPD